MINPFRMSLFAEISRRHEEFLLEFINWYKGKKYILKVSQFVELDNVFQVIAFHIFLHEKHNIGILFDQHSSVLYWVNPTDKLAASDIENRYNSTGKFTHVFEELYGLPKVKAEYAYKRAVMRAIEYVVEPF